MSQAEKSTCTDRHHISTFLPDLHPKSFFISHILDTKPKGSFCNKTGYNHKRNVQTRSRNEFCNEKPVNILDVCL